MNDAELKEPQSATAPPQRPRLNPLVRANHQTGESASEEALPRRLEQIERELQEMRRLLQSLDSRLFQELEILKQSQFGQSETLGSLDRNIRRGRMLRRIGFTIRLLVWLALIGAGVFLFYNWQDFMPFDIR